ncbi:MAG: alpha/beta hydrolase [Frankiales bacterium]|nr:alpha/beta hydrolase [Frankiales bacterium]
MLSDLTDVRHESFDVRGGPLAVLRAGAGDRPPVLLVPGFTGSKEDFRLLLTPLAQAGFPVVALDQRGQFQSPGPQELGAYDVDVLAQDLLAVVERIGGPVHLVGHSFGGLVARAAVLTAPAAFRSLTLMSSGPAGLTGPRIALVALMKPLLELGMPALVEAMDAMNAVDARHLALDASLQGFLRERMLASSARGMLGMTVGLEHEPDRVDALRQTGVPVLVLNGADDDAWSPSLQAEMAVRLGAQHTVIDGAVHSPAVEQPAATAAALVAFFAGLPR